MESNNTKKQIAVIGLKGLPAFGGAAAVGESIIDELKENYQFTVYSTSSHTHLKTGYYNNCKQIVFRKISLKKINVLWYYITSAIHAVIFSKYDLIHLHHRDAAFIIPFLKLRYKVVVTTHNSFALTDKWKKYAFYFEMNERFFVKFADRITCVSKNEVRKFKNQIGINVLHIPNGIKKQCELKQQMPEHTKYIFFGSGRVVRTKGLHILLAALNKLNYTGKLLIAGDLNQVDCYKNEILEMTTKLDVVFMGLIKNKNILMNYIKNSELFVYPSSMEAMSMMLLEGVSVKAPIICSDIIENKDIFNDEEILFFEVDNPNDLAEKINFALENPEIMQQKAEKAFLRLISDYNWKDISQQYAEVYNSLL